MKRIIGLSIAALLVIMMVGGGSWAWFNDDESSPDNSLTAGTLDLKIDGGDTPVTTFAVTNVAPGDSGNGSVTLSNAGASSIVGELDIVFSAVTNTAGTVGEFADASGDLGGIAEIAVYVDVDESSDWNSGDIGLKSDGTTYTTSLDWDTINNYDSETWDAVVPAMAASASDGFIIQWQVPTSANNTIQGDSVSFDVTFYLQQPEAD